MIGPPFRVAAVLAVVVLSTRAGSTQQAPLLIPPVLHPALVTWDPSSLVNGAPCLFRVKPSVPVKSLTGLWLTRTVPFEFDPADGSWFAFAGVGLNVSEGEYPLDLEGIGNDGSKGLFRANVRVERGSYRTVDLRVADRFTAPSAATGLNAWNASTPRWSGETHSLGPLRHSWMTSGAIGGCSRASA